ncbi:DNA alkylation repair protein [Sulfurimonas sp.]|uniref:DNA alkylation repair protein n=1 Tax=Sulfurimonas sp. TaxID=2022749 RepID=UPI003D09D3EA
MEPFKNIYNEKEIVKLANEIKNVYPEFQKDAFVNSLINEAWEAKELKERLRAISLSLGEFLDQDYLKALEILKQVHTNFSGLFHLVFPDFVEVFGLEQYEASIKALKLFTPQCTSEFAVRPFLVKYPEFIEVFKRWAEDENEHIRRLASEGCRPRLPWGIALGEYKKDPTKVLEVLELLKEDESEYVRKSVANNLNDISKDNPAIAKAVFKKWYGDSKHTNWIVKHGSRTLLKAGEQDVLELFGYKSDGIEVANLQADQSVQMGEYLNFSFDISSKKPLGKLRIEYKLGLLRQNNKINYKVFKISEREVTDRELSIKKSHAFKEVTTRKYYDGIHTLTIVINGKEFTTSKFELIT